MTVEEKKTVQENFQWWLGVRRKQLVLIWIRSYTKSLHYTDLYPIFML